MPAVSVRARVAPEVWSSYFKFCVERDPFDKTLSFYHMLKARGQVSDLDDMFARGLLPADWTRYSDYDGSVLVLVRDVLGRYPLFSAADDHTTPRSDRSLPSAPVTATLNATT